MSGEIPDADADEAVKIFRVNSNALVIIDSDRRKPSQELNATKRRIISEVEGIGDMVWVTAGKEVENYIPVDALQSLYADDEIPPVEPYADIANYLNEIKDKEGDKYLQDKVRFAGKVIPHITRERLSGVLDLEEKVTEALDRIREWNGSGRSRVIPAQHRHEPVR